MRPPGPCSGGLAAAVALAVFAGVARSVRAPAEQRRPAPGRARGAVDSATTAIKHLPPDLHDLVLDFVALKSDILVSSGGRDVALWASDGAVRALDRHTANVLGVGFFPMGDRAFTFGDDCYLVVWNTTTGAATHALDHVAPVLDAQVFAHGELLVTVDATNTQTIWSTVTFAPVASRWWPSVLSLEAARRGRRVVVTDTDSAYVWHAGLHDDLSCDLPATFLGIAVVMFPNGDRVLVLGEAEGETGWSASIWRTSGCTLAHRLGQAWWPAAVSARGDLVAACVPEGVAVWRARCGTRVAVLRMPQAEQPDDEDDDGDGGIIAMRFLQQRDLVVVLTSRAAVVFDPRTGKMLASAGSGQSAFQTLAVSPGGDVFATCGPQETVLWEALSGARLLTWNSSNRRGERQFCRVAIGLGRALGPRQFGGGASARAALAL